MVEITADKITTIERGRTGEEPWDLCPYGRVDKACGKENESHAWKLRLDHQEREQKWDRFYWVFKFSCGAKSAIGKI